MKNVILATVIALSALAVAPAHAQAPQQNTQVDPEVAAQQRLAAWQNEQKACFISARLEEGKHFRLKQGSKTIYQIHDNVWLNPASFDLAKLRTCRTGD